MSRAAIPELPVRERMAGARDGQAGAGHRPRAPSAVLDLQRAVGNRAVSGLLQRKFGFEAELQVNTFGRDAKSDLARQFKKGPATEGRAGHDCPPAVIDFLLGGLPYGKERGWNESFFLKPDHGGPATTGVLDIFHAVHGLKSGDGRPMAPDPAEVKDDGKPSNLEYESLPIEELAKDSDAALARQVEALGKHVDGIFQADALRSEIIRIPSPAKDMWTGVPVKEFKDWLGPAYYEWGISGWIETLRDELQDRFYVQVTAGVIPSALPLLYLEHAKEADAQYAAGDTAIKVHALMAREVRSALEALIRLPAFYEDDDDFIEGLSAVEEQALHGLLYLAYSYVVGAAVNRTDAIGSTPKNAVPFLAQMDWATIRNKALPGKLRNQKVPDKLVETIAGFFADRAKADTGNWLGDRTELKLGPSPPGRARLIGEEDVRTFFTRLLTNQDFIPFLIGKPLKGDKQPPEVKKASQQQRGIPLEHRFILERPSSRELLAVLKGYLAQARRLNTRHLGQEEADALIAAAEGKSKATSGGSEAKDGDRKS